MICHSVRPLPGYPPVLYQALTEVDLDLFFCLSLRVTKEGRGWTKKKKTTSMLRKHDSVQSKHKFKKLSFFTTVESWNREKVKCHSTMFYCRAAIFSIPRWRTSNGSRNLVRCVCFYSNRRLKYNIKALWSPISQCTCLDKKNPSCLLTEAPLL